MTAPGHTRLMDRALLEAARAQGRTCPNPMVGCVIANGARIIAVGHHERAGRAHAEAVALRRAGARARGADVYVTLEPCSHFGRTAPCADALIEAGVGRVFVATRDPNPLVNGRGLRRLRHAGIAVEVGMLGPACRRLNEAFEFTMRHGRPFVVAKVAQSIDGRVATRTGESQWISRDGQKFGQMLRNNLDAIMIGVGTASADDPSLTCRLRGGRDPVRIILDTHARLSPRAQVVCKARDSTAPTWVCVGPLAPVRQRRALEKAGAEIVVCKLNHEGRLDLRDVLQQTTQREILSVLVEGGPTVLGGLFDASLVNRLHACIAPMIIGGTQAWGSVGGQGIAQLSEAHRLLRWEMRSLGRDLLVSGDFMATESSDKS